MQRVAKAVEKGGGEGEGGEGKDKQESSVERGADSKRKPLRSVNVTDLALGLLRGEMDDMEEEVAFREEEEEEEEED